MKTPFKMGLAQSFIFGASKEDAPAAVARGKVKRGACHVVRLCVNFRQGSRQGIEVRRNAIFRQDGDKRLEQRHEMSCGRRKTLVKRQAAYNKKHALTAEGANVGEGVKASRLCAARGDQLGSGNSAAALQEGQLT
jgi:hypothetical protein